MQLTSLDVLPFTRQSLIAPNSGDIQYLPHCRILFLDTKSNNNNISDIECQIAVRKYL